MWYVLGALAYVGIGHFLAGFLTNEDPDDPMPDSIVFQYMVLWWFFWPFTTVITLAGRAALRARGLADAEGNLIDKAAEEARIDDLERQLGIGRYAGIHQFPVLEGTAPEACQLVNYEEHHRFYARYGLSGSYFEDKTNKAELDAAVSGLTQITDDFAAWASTHSDQDLISGAELALRKLTRVEQAMEPLFAGLAFASYGRARKACIDARARIATILDESALSG